MSYKLNSDDVCICKDILAELKTLKIQYTNINDIIDSGRSTPAHSVDIR